MSSDVTKSAPVVDRPIANAWRIEAITGPAKGAVARVSGGVVRVGSATSNDIVLDDPNVSRHHLVLEIRPSSIRVRDLGSKNGTHYRGSRVETAELPGQGCVLRLGSTELALSPDSRDDELMPSPRDRCGRMLAQSEAMRLMFAQIERVAKTSATVLLEGETGTGKDLAAEALHDLSARGSGPFVVLDCGSIPKGLIESELFGHVRGAFTGATSDRQGAFEAANTGTIFLDEIAELALDLQPRLLRVLETGQVKRVGATTSKVCDVRVIAASHRDLVSEVAEGRFRQDLFYRLSVVHLLVPPLRARPDDVVLLAEHFAREFGAPGIDPASIPVLVAAEWPGNVRQLRNVIERAMALSDGGPLRIRATDLESKPMRPASSAPQLPYKLAKEEVVARFTKEYLETLLGRHQGNVSAAAREAQVDRNWIVALARRVGVRVRD